MVRLRQSVEAVNRQALLLVGGFATASIFLALVLGFVTSWSFILPVRAAEGFLGQIAKGNFSATIARSEERRGGTECVSPCRSRSTPYHKTKTTCISIIQYNSKQTTK